MRDRTYFQFAKETLWCAVFFFILHCIISGYDSAIIGIFANGCLLGIVLFGGLSVLYFLLWLSSSSKDDC